mgnify:CR=1 FL=1
MDTSDRIDYINYYFYMEDRPSYRELAKELGISTNALKQFIYRHRAEIPKIRTGWTQHELTTLKKYYRRYSNEEVARLLGRTPDAVQQKAAELGLRRHHDHSDLIKRMRKLDTANMTVPEIAEELDTAQRFVRHCLRHYKLSFKRQPNSYKEVCRMALRRIWKN